jgi:hypothetical protein
MATLKREANDRAAMALAKKTEFFHSNPGIREEYEFMVNNFYRGGKGKSQEHADIMMQYMANVCSNPLNLRHETVDRQAAVKVAIPKYTSALYFVESYMYLNMHKYPLFYEHMNADSQKRTLTSNRLCSYFSGDCTNMQKSLSSYEAYAGLVYYTHKLEAKVEGNTLLPSTSAVELVQHFFG